MIADSSSEGSIERSAATISRKTSGARCSPSITIIPGKLKTLNAWPPSSGWMNHERRREHQRLPGYVRADDQVGEHAADRQRDEGRADRERERVHHHLADADVVVGAAEVRERERAAP